MGPRSGEEFQRQAMQFIRETYQIPAEILENPHGGYLLYLRLPEQDEKFWRGPSRKGIAIEAVSYCLKVENSRLPSFMGMFAIMLRRTQHDICKKRILKLEEFLRVSVGL